MQDNAFHYIFTTLILVTLKKKKEEETRGRVELKVTLDFSYLDAKVSFCRVWICMYKLLWKPDQSQQLHIQNYVGGKKKKNRQWTSYFYPNAFHYLDGLCLRLVRKLAPIVTNVCSDVLMQCFRTSIILPFFFYSGKILRE